MSDQIIPNNQENEPKTQTYQLKKGVSIDLAQRNKIMNMPLKNLKMSFSTNEQGKQVSEVAFGLLMENQTNLVEYLMKLFYEPEVDFLNISNEEYKRLEKEIRVKNPFGVFDIKLN